MSEVKIEKLQAQIIDLIKDQTKLEKKLETIKTENNFLSDHLGFAKERIEKLEVIYEQNIDRIIAYSDMEKEFKELSELKASSASHTESLETQRTINSVKTNQIRELKKKQNHWATLENVTVCRLGIENIEEVLQELIDELSEGKKDQELAHLYLLREKLSGDFNLDDINKHDYEYYLKKKLGGDKSDIVSGTGGAAPTRNAECEDVNPEIINESQPSSKWGMKPHHDDYEQPPRKDLYYEHHNPSEQLYTDMTPEEKMKETQKINPSEQNCYTCGCGSNCYQEVGRCHNSDKWKPKEVADPLECLCMDCKLRCWKWNELILVEKEELIKLCRQPNGAFKSLMREKYLEEVKKE